MLNENQTKIDNLIGSALNSLNNFIDVNTVVGTPITAANGTVIIPISKVTIGYLTGGGEYGDLKVVKKDNIYPFGGGNGAVISMKPYGFLIDNGSGFKLINAGTSPIDKLMNTAQEVIEKLSGNDEVH